jgi:ABC-type nickel/cobalt efflux system permease component RcnA
MKTFRRSIIVIFTLLVCFTLVPAAFAHPLGNFTVNHYAGLLVSRDQITIDYVMDMAEIAAFQEIELLDANGNLKPDPDEAAGYPAVRCASLRPSLSLSLNNRPVRLSLASSSVEFPAGVGGLPTMRLTCEFQAPADIADGPVALSFQNQVFADRLGWQEIVVIPDGVSVQGEYSTTSLSNRLTSYPEDLLTSPLEQREIALEVTALGSPAQNQPAVSADGSKSSLSDRNDAFTRLILLENFTLPTLLFALVVAFLWGAAHALTPGHGKTIVGAYLVGSRGTLKHALYLGLTTTITHTLGVFALGLITLFAAQYIVPETLYPWMSLFSGLLVIGIGVQLLITRYRASGLSFPDIKASISSRAYSPVFEHTQVEESRHAHAYVLTRSHAGAHTHGHSHSHGHGYHDRDHDHADHSHLPPGADGSPVTWRSLLALGVSGGLIPCPSALVVMLGAIALNKIGFGLVLVLAFSLGLAGALTAIGMLFIYAGRLFERFPSQGWVIRLLPVLSALFVSAIGAAIIWKALVEII